MLAALAPGQRHCSALPTSSSPRCEDCSSLSRCLPKEWMQFSIWKEEGLGSASSSSAAHVRIWGNKLKALPSLGAPVCCQVTAGDPPNVCLPKMCLSHGWAAPPPARAWLLCAHRV